MKRYIPEAIRNRALAADHADWLAQLDETVAALEAQWHIRVGEALPGGTHAYVAPATGDDGKDYIFKLDQPEESDVFTPEIRFLQQAQGRGYVQMYEVDLDRRACLLEPLGASLASLDLPPREQMRILCQTLQLIWDCPVTEELPDGRQSLQWFREFIPATNKDLGYPLSDAAIARAMAYLDTREAAYDPADHVLIHGDANAQNILQSRDSATGFKLIDADGLVYEKAYDLGVLMREWREEYTNDPLQAAQERCEYLHRLTGVDRAAIWQWGYLQCVATALVAWNILPDDARALAQMAEAWCDTACNC